MSFKKLIKYFLPSLVLFFLFRLLSLFSTCIYTSDYSYYLDPFSPCKSNFWDISLYHWLILLAILPGLNYVKALTGESAKQNRTMFFFNIFLNIIFIILILLILLFKSFLDFPFWSYFV